MTRRPVPPAALAAVICAAAIPCAQQPSFRYERQVLTDAAGGHRLAPDVTLLSAASRFAQRVPLGGGDAPRWRAEDGLSDLRLFDSSGREVPYLLVYPDSGVAQWIGATVVPVAATQKTSGFEADLGAPATVDSIQIEGLPAPFLKRLVLEGSGDRQRWTLLAGEGTLFDLPREQLRQLRVPFAAGAYRYLRVTWNDTNSGRVPLPRRVMAQVAGPVSSRPAELSADASIETRPSEPRRSRYRIRLPGAGLPIVALHLDVSDPYVFRNAVVTEPSLQGGVAVPAEIGRATLSRVVHEGVTAAALRIPVTSPREARLDLVVEDGDNPPLSVKRVRLEFAELPWIYFISPGGTLTARYGDRLARAPRYDLEAARRSIRIGEASEARWGAAPSRTTETTGARPSGVAASGAPLDASLFRYRRPLDSTESGLAAVPLDAAVLAHSRGPSAGFSDVRLADGSGRQVPYLLEHLQEPLSLDLTLEPYKPPSGLDLQKNESAYAVTVPFTNLPSSTLVLETSARVFSRSVLIATVHPADRGHRQPWLQRLASSEWRHADTEDPAPALDLTLPPVTERQIIVAVDEGDNSPLTISRARLLLPAYRLRFFHPGGSLQLLYGRDDLTPPRYDLALLAPEVMGADARETQAAGETGDVEARSALVSPRLFWIGLSIAVLIVAGLIVRLVKSVPPAG